MEVKVSGIKDLKEALLLADNGVDIVSFSLLEEANQAYSTYFTEPRFVNLTQIAQIRAAVQGPKISVFLELWHENYLEQLELVKLAIQECGLDYVEWDSRFDTLPVPIIDPLGIHHDVHLPTFLEYEFEARPGILQLSFDGILSDWSWWKQEAEQYDDVIKIVDIQMLLKQRPEMILDYPVNEQNYQEVFEYLPAKTWNFTLGSKQDNDNNYSLEEVMSLIKQIKNYRC